MRCAHIVLALLTAAHTGVTTAASLAPAADPAEMAVKASRSLLLDIVNTGGQLVAVGERGNTGGQLVAVGERGNIVVSGNGKDWKQVPVPVRATLTAVHFADVKNGWAVGHDAAIVHTTDGGKTWALQSYQPERNQPLLDVLFLDTQRGYAVGSFGLFLNTLDGGKTWTEVEVPVIKEEGSHLNAIIRLRDGALLIAGERGLLVASADGVTWDKLPVTYEGSYFGAVAMGEKGALVFGLRGNAFMAEDLRGVWKPVTLGSTRTAFGGTPAPDGRAALVGADGLALFVATDGSSSASGLRQEAASSGTLSAVAPWGNAYIAVGDQGIVPLGE